MSDPRYQPRRYAVEPSEFARAEVIRWREVDSDLAHEQLYASQHQHAWCYLIQKQARKQHRSLRAYADSTKQAYDRLARVMRGEGILRLDDIGLATHHLGFMHEDAHQILRHMWRPPNTRPLARPGTW